MTGKKKIILGLALVVLVTMMLGATAVRAQEDDDSDHNAMDILIQGQGDSWLGVDLKDVTADQARALKLGDSYGALVNKVEQDSPAAKAGIESGDVIVAFAGERVHSTAELRRLVGETPPGRTVPIEIRRQGEIKTLNVSLANRGDRMGPLMSHLRENVWPDVNLPVYDFAFNFGGPRLGVEVDELTPQLGAYFGVKDGKGVLVREVTAGSAAEKAGLKAGDCILKLEATPVQSADDLHRALLKRQQEKSQDVTLTIVRDRKEQTLTIHLEAPARPGRHVVSESARNGMPALDELEASEQKLFDAQALASQARELKQQLESQGEFKKQAEAARAEAKQVQDEMRQYRDQLQNEKGEWQQYLKQLGPEMKQLQDEMKKLRDQYGYGSV